MKIEIKNRTVKSDSQSANTILVGKGKLDFRFQSL